MSDSSVITVHNPDLQRYELRDGDTVIVVKEGKDTKIYWFDAAADKKHHGEICKSGKNATVKGVVSEKDGKLHIKVSDCKFD